MEKTYDKEKVDGLLQAFGTMLDSGLRKKGAELDAVVTQAVAIARQVVDLVASGEQVNMREMTDLLQSQYQFNGSGSGDRITYALDQLRRELTAENRVLPEPPASRPEGNHTLSSMCAGSEWGEAVLEKNWRDAGGENDPPLPPASAIIRSGLSVAAPQTPKGSAVTGKQAATTEEDSPTLVSGL